MNYLHSIPPPILPTKRNAGDDPESILSAILSLKHGNFTFECLSRKWDKRYRFEHPDLGLVVFDENGEKLIFTTIDYTREEVNEFNGFLIGWKHLENLQN